jgi:peptidoglycan/xylan/chitin deacetylase (PgdA/CDA1 family)
VWAEALLFALGAVPLLLAPPAFAAQPDDDRGTPILLYHRFGPVVADSMTVTTRVFEEQLLAIRERGYQVVPARQLVAHFRGEAPAPPRLSVVITADDGHRSVYTDMWPLVRRYAVPVTLFIYPSAISRASYALTWEQLGELARSGLVDIESHTYWHPDFRQEKRRLTATEYERFATSQLVRSKQVLEVKLGIRATLLAWPFGIYDADLMHRAASLGYAGAFTLERRAARASDPVMGLPRHVVTDADRGTRFERLLGAPGARN